MNPVIIAGLLGAGFWYVTRPRKRVQYQIRQDGQKVPIRTIDTPPLIDFNKFFGNVPREATPMENDTPMQPGTSTQSLPGILRLSSEGINFIAQWEGFVPTPYEDIAGHPTIGYGHKILPHETFNPVVPITVEEAQNLLRADAQIAESAVTRLVAVPVTQRQYDALVSFAYNVGAQAFGTSTLLKKLNAGDYNGASDEFQRWNKATVDGKLVVIAGLSNRRNAERGLFVA